MLPVLTMLAVLAIVAAGCSDRPAQRAAPQVVTNDVDHGLAKVALLGDSVAASLAVPLTQAFAAGNIRFVSLAADGGGNVVGPFARKRWARLPDQIAEAEADLVLYQITGYDWGSRKAQRAGYERLLDTVADTGATLAFVTLPPIRPDDFYRPHMADLKRTEAVARAVVADSGGRAVLLDAAAVWGDEFQRTRDGKVERSKDGVHVCPQGAARYTAWLLDELAKLYPGYSPAPARTWANSGWSADEHFRGC